MISTEELSTNRHSVPGISESASSLDKSRSALQQITRHPKLSFPDGNHSLDDSVLCIVSRHKPWKVHADDRARLSSANVQVFSSSLCSLLSALLVIHARAAHAPELGGDLKYDAHVMLRSSSSP